MLRDLKSGVIAVVLLTLLLGLGLPALFTGFAQLAFPSQAKGSLISRNGAVIGSRLVAQQLTSRRYIHARPSGTAPADNGAGTTFSNLGPTSSQLAAQIRQHANAILTLERPYNPTLTIHQIPVDAVTTSGSGVDPDISPAYAQLQARRVAAVRRLPLATVERLIHQNTDGRWLGLFGEPGVNVLALDLALDEDQR